MPRNILIVGASKGIGYALAKGCIERGEKVTLLSRSLESLKELQKQYPDQVQYDVLDVANLDCENRLNEIAKNYAPFDVVILNAGTGYLNKDFNLAQDIQTIQTNVIGATTVLNWGYRHLSENGGGTLVGMSSVACLFGGANTASYNASKAYLSNFLEALRNRAFQNKEKVDVVDIRPGYVDTEFVEGDNLFWMSTPEEATKHMIRAIDKKKQIAYITPRWKLIAIALKIMPFWLIKRIL